MFLPRFRESLLKAVAAHPMAEPIELQWPRPLVYFLALELAIMACIGVLWTLAQFVMPIAAPHELPSPLRELVGALWLIHAVLLFRMANVLDRMFQMTRKR